MLTATQIALHNAHKARIQRLSPRPRPQPKPKVVAVQEVEPDQAWVDRQIENHKLYWFSVVDCIKLTPTGKPTIRTIQRAVCEFYGVSLEDMLSSRRSAKLVFPRHVSMYLANELTNLSFRQISMATGRGDHTTSRHAAKKIEALMKKDETFAAKIATIRGQFE